MTGEFAIAVHALVYLNHKKEVLSSDELAANVCTNPARVRKVMAKLKKAGLLSTKEGAEGGYYFSQNADEVNLDQICKAVEAQVVSASWKSGNKGMKCLIASGMADIMDGIYDQLNLECKRKLSEITISDIDAKIFKKEQ